MNVRSLVVSAEFFGRAANAPVSGQLIKRLALAVRIFRGSINEEQKFDGNPLNSKGVHVAFCVLNTLIFRNLKKTPLIDL